MGFFADALKTTRLIMPNNAIWNIAERHGIQGSVTVWGYYDDGKCRWDVIPLMHGDEAPPILPGAYLTDLKALAQSQNQDVYLRVAKPARHHDLLRPAMMAAKE